MKKLLMIGLLLLVGHNAMAMNGDQIEREKKIKQQQRTALEMNLQQGLEQAAKNDLAQLDAMIVDGSLSLTYRTWFGDFPKMPQNIRVGGSSKVNFGVTDFQYYSTAALMLGIGLFVGYKYAKNQDAADALFGWDK